MSAKATRLLASIRWSIAYIVVIPVVISAIIIWISYQRISDFEKAQYNIAESTVVLASKEVSELIKNQQRLVGIFTRNEHELIDMLAQSPNDDSLKQQLSQKLLEYFPNHFTFTLADHEGIPILDDFEGYIGERCLRDIKRVASGQEQNIHIHPNPYVYHIDIMTRWGSSQKGGIFFVSFRTDFLGKFLSVSSPHRHELMLVNTEIQDLIEITEKGARISLKRDDFRLTEKEQVRMLYSAPVAKTNWKLTDFREPNLFSDYRNEIITFSAMIIIIFLIGSLIMTVALLRVEKRRLAAEKIKEEMFSLFNHDLRSPLNGIYATMQLFTQDAIYNDHEGCKKLAGAGFNNAEIMLGLVNDILDVQKMESGGMEFEFEQTELVSLVKKTIDINTQYGEMHKVSFELVNYDSEVYIKADKKRLQQALTNLISNAIKYSPENETVTILVATKGEYTRISVSDKGPGIPKEFQPLVFGKFSQSKSELTRSIGGTGLGLTIVKYIVDSHGGYVHFETEAGKGTIFHIDL